MISFIFDFIVSPSNISGQNWTSSGCVLLFGSFDLYRNFELVVGSWMQTAIPVDVTFWLLGFPFACKFNQSERTVLHGRRSRFSPFDSYKHFEIIVRNHKGQVEEQGLSNFAGTEQSIGDRAWRSDALVGKNLSLNFWFQGSQAMIHSFIFDFMVLPS